MNTGYSTPNDPSKLLHLQMTTYIQSSEKWNTLINITALVQHLSSDIQKVKIIAVVTPCAFVICWLSSGFNLQDKISHTYQELFVRTLKLIVIWLRLCKKNKTATTFLITSDKSLKFPFTLNHIRDKVRSSSSITGYYIPYVWNHIYYAGVKNIKKKDEVDVNSWQNFLLQIGKSGKWREECKCHKFYC
jgi:hypothetical protein